MTAHEHCDFGTYHIYWAFMGPSLDF